MNTVSTILVVDDEPSICWALQRMLTGEGHRVLTASSAEEGLALVADTVPDMVILDVRLPNEDGITALPKFLKATNHAPTIIITAFGDLETAVAAVKNGATDYLTKPLTLEETLRTCRSTLGKSRSRATPTATKPIPFDNSVLIGVSPAMQQVFRQIALVADSELSVLITGETGTGKELVAAAIHRHSCRADQPYIAIAPVTLNPDLIESELFGHVKGSFTGAGEDRAGLFEQAQNGTVLLDEIGDLPLGVQVKLLRVLEHGEYCRVGEVIPRMVNVRILAATNCDLHEAVTAGRFREDLFHRLNGVQIHLPPLRDRIEDIEPLCRHFLDAMHYSETENAIDSELFEALQEFPWHGNVRELKNAVAHATVVARGRGLAIDDFPEPKPRRGNPADPPRASLDQMVRTWTQAALDQGSSELDSLQAKLVAATEPALLEVVLQHTGGNRAKAAELLGMHRGTLRDRLRIYGIDQESN